MKNLLMFVAIALACTTCLDANAGMCERITGTTAVASTVTGTAAASSSVWLPTLGVTVVAHSSGAAIATGAAGYIAGSMAALAAAPWVVAGAGVVALSSGAAYVYCKLEK